jgi:eukaryotic-like serine/threonine-protein kinase
MKPCPSCAAPVRNDATFCTACGFKIEVVGPPPTGQFNAGAVVDGKYRIVRILGEGGMGVVYLARALHTEVDVVVKAVRPEIAHRPDIRERTLAEGKALAHIDHPNVVQLKSVVVTDNDLLLVMQYIDGETLEDRIVRHRSEGRPMPLGEVINIFRQVLQGVAAAHAEHVIHRDIKPGNILIRKKDGAVKVTDFGIAKPEEDARESQRLTKGIIGSVHYMSPEQVTGQRQIDRRADVYALGILLFEMLTGKVPFDAESTYEIFRQHVEDPIPSVSAGRPDLPPALDMVLSKACAKSRDDRYKSCEEFLEALKGIEDQPTGSGVTVGPMRTIPGIPSGAFVQPPAVQQFVNAVTGAQPVHPGHVPVHTDPGGVPMMTPQQGFPPYQAGYGQPGYGAQPNTMQSYGHANITAPAAALPQRSGGGRGVAIGLIVAALVAGAIAVPFALGWRPGQSSGGDTSPETIETREDKKKKKTTTTPSTTASNTPGVSPLAKLEGKWASDRGNPFSAVLVGDRLEFQVVDESRFKDQGYRAGEARFVLTVVEGEPDTFAVEDRVRPTPPLPYSSDDARATCIAVFTNAASGPLRARLSGDRLDVQAAKIDPTEKNFTLGNGKTISCRALESLTAAITPVTLLKQ